MGLFVLALWARRYRASVDPAERTLHRPEPSQAAEPPPWSKPSRRYYLPVFERIVCVASLPLAVALAIGVTLAQLEVVLTVIMWVIALATVYYLWMLLVTFVDIGPNGILVRKPRNRRLIAWGDLVEIRWERETGADYPVFCVSDGTQVKSPFGVAATGIGEKRMLRMLHDVELAWRWQLRVPAGDKGVG